MEGLFLRTGDNKKAFKNAQLLLFSIGYKWANGENWPLEYEGQGISLLDKEWLYVGYDEYCKEEDGYEIIDVAWLSEVDI